MACNWLDMAEFRLRAEIPSTASPAAVAGVLAGVASTIQGLIGSPVSQMTREYTLAGHGTANCVLPERPIYVGEDGLADLHVYVLGWDEVPPAGELEYGEDFGVAGDADPQAGALYRMQGILERRHGNLWPIGSTRWPNRLATSLVPRRRTIRVTGIKIGWLPADIPAAITEAGYLEAATRWNMRKEFAGPFTSESLNGYSYSVAQPPPMTAYGAPRLMSALAAMMLAPFVSYGVSVVR